ncbi:hypothetical protein BHM03_00061430 [Ensete ventricosum]|nr:hypothetical protein BHM03_00061430 [Ensete ventricosum]
MEPTSTRAFAARAIRTSDGKPHRLARLTLRGPIGSGQPQGVHRKRALAACSPRWHGSLARPSRARWRTAPSSTMASPEQLASLQLARLAPSPWPPETRTCLGRLPHDGTYVGSKPWSSSFGRSIPRLDACWGPRASSWPPLRTSPLQPLLEEFLARQEGEVDSVGCSSTELLTGTEEANRGCPPPTFGKPRIILMLTISAKPAMSRDDQVTKYRNNVLTCSLRSWAEARLDQPLLG